IAGAKTQKEKERREIKEEIEERMGIKPTPLPEAAKIIYSTDVLSEIEAEMVQGKMRVTITLSGERKYTVSERARPPSIIINIPHTINTVFPGKIMINRGGVRMIEVTQHRAVPFDETRVIIRLSRFKEYEIKSEGNEICVEFEK
ncbi:AMIN domain-containing protein, partial [bacterium]|nr:AMIN domain-containing protein [bacterium]